MLKETAGQILKIGDKVRMNIPVIGAGDLDGIEVTASGVNYWRYMCQHPDEIYTVTGFDYSNNDETGYTLSDAMAGNNWYSNELILVPAADTRFEKIKSMTFEAFLMDRVNGYLVDNSPWLKPGVLRRSGYSRNSFLSNGISSRQSRSGQITR